MNFIYRWPAAVTVLIRSVQGGGHVLSTMLPEILLLGVLTNIILIGCLWTIAPSLALNGDLRNAIQEIFYVKLSVRMRIIFVYMLISVASFLPRAWLGAHGYSLEVGELFPWILVNVWSAALHLIWYIFVAVYYIEFTGFRNRLDDVFS